MKGEIYGIGNIANIVPMPSIPTISVQSPYSSNSASNPMFGTLLGAGVGLANGIIGAVTQNRANKQNAQLMREQMAWSEDQAAKQMNWQRDMWNAQNSYNTPSAQRKRLEDAGINPYLAMGNISTGTATSTPNGAQPSLPSAPQMQPIHFDLGSLIQGMAALENVRSIGLDNKRKSIENKYLDEFLGGRNTIQSNDAAMSDTLFGTRVAMEKINLEIRALEKQGMTFSQTLQRIDIGRQRYINSKLPELMNAQIDLIRSNKRVNDETIKKLIQETLQLDYKNQVDKQLIDDLAKYLQSFYRLQTAINDAMDGRSIGLSRTDQEKGGVFGSGTLGEIMRILVLGGSAIGKGLEY